MENETLATSDGSNLQALLEEFRNAGANGDFWSKQSTADDTRLARWDGQSDDGKKWDINQTDGVKAFPWNGASDVRCYQADEVINEDVATKITAFWRSDVRIEGIEPDDLESASSSTRFMEWMRGSDLRRNLEEDVELSAQFEDAYGWCALHVTWERLLSYKWKNVNMDALSQMAQQIQQAPDQIPPEQQDMATHLAMFPQMVADPQMEDMAIQSLKFLYRVYVNQSLPSNVDEDEIPELATKRARSIVRDLRKDGKASIPVPYVCKNKPCITALKPWRDFVIPSDTTDIQSARAVFIRQFMTEADLLGMVHSDGWDEEFVREAIETKGRVSVWQFANQGLLNPLTQWAFTQQKNNLIEIVVGYHKAVDDDGITAVYYTIFSSHITSSNDGKDLIGKTGMLDYPTVDEYPVVITRREGLDRQVMASRGIPELLLTSQREEKVLRDATMDWCSIGVVPPLNTYKGQMGQRYKFAPAAENIVTPGREPKLMEISAQGPSFAIEYLQHLKASVDHYFGRIREDVPPQLASLLGEPKIKRFLSAWAAALKIAFCLYQKYAPEKFERITNQPSPGEDSAEMDFIFHFDIAQLNPETMELKLNAFSNLLPEDSVGVIDRSALIRAKARMIDPALARELVMDKGPASQQLFETVKSDVMAMSDGNQASYIDAAKDPTAQSRMQYLSQIIGSNIKYLGRIDPQLLQQLQIQIPPEMQQMQSMQQGAQQQVDPIFTSLIEKYVKNLTLGISQQQNKTIGRIGVQQ